MTGEQHRQHDHPANQGQHDHHAPDHIVEGHRTHHFDPARAERLYGEERHQAMPPEPILRAAGITAGQVVVDLGAGPGFFTLPAAQLVGQSGRVYAADVAPSMLEMCQRRAAEAGLTWIETVRSEESHVPLPAATADRVLISFVLHEADDPTALLREAARLLRPGGEVAVVEAHKKEGTPGPPMEHRIGEEEVAALAPQVGLQAAPVEHRGERYYVSRLRRLPS